jgi:oxygen-independent coproporphyrinogen III oxidase
MSLMMNFTEREQLIRKYNVPGPRYTSYPTVPYWDTKSFSRDNWKLKISEVFKNSKEEISLYIHLPYCESLCTFCGCNTRITINHKVETPYIETVLKEWDLYLALMETKPLIKEIHLGGGTPTFFSPANLEKLISGLTQKVSLAQDAELGFEGHPNNTTKEHLEKLYHLGFTRVSFGIQDFDPKVQDVIHRKQSFEKVKEVTEIARATGYTSINYDIVYGLPLQTLNSVKDTIEKVKILKPDRIAFYSYAHVPWIKPGQRKFTELDLPDDETKRSLYEHGRNMLEEAGYQEIGMDHFALKSDSLYKAALQKKLHRNFMGYTSSRTSQVIGLGVSSISDLWEAYGQNVKTVEEYKALVDAGTIPVFRGHFLNAEDLILRQHILNIMCQYRTSWTKPAEQCTALFNGLGRMKDLEKDGLIKVGISSLEVTEEGGPFIRNICMALDARMHAQEKNEIKFSKVI